MLSSEAKQNRKLPNKPLHPTANSAAFIENLSLSQLSARRVNRGVVQLRIIKSDKLR